jgi:Capsular polysaccharide biosynthesis protein
MWPFSHHYSLDEIGFLNGSVDYHCHILPGVDDGVRNLEKSLAALSYFEEAGVTEVWLTPHIMDDFPNSTHSLRQGYNKLRAAYNGSLIMHLASENMIDSTFEQRFSDDDLLTMGDGTHLLVETSYFNPPMHLYDTLDQIRSHGLFPVLAHPERYFYMNVKDYDRLKDMGVQFQLSIMSLTGMYGEEAAVKARHLLWEDKYDFYGSDLHRLSLFRKALDAKVLTGKDVNALQKLKLKAHVESFETVHESLAWNVG